MWNKRLGSVCPVRNISSPQTPFKVTCGIRVTVGNHVFIGAPAAAVSADPVRIVVPPMHLDDSLIIRSELRE